MTVSAGPGGDPNAMALPDPPGPGLIVVGRLTILGLEPETKSHPCSSPGPDGTASLEPVVVRLSTVEATEAPSEFLSDAPSAEAARLSNELEPRVGEHEYLIVATAADHGVDVNIGSGMLELDAVPA